MDQPRDDSQIAAGLRAGRQEAWFHMYDLHVHQVWRLVARLAAPHTTAVPDIVQETFLAAARGARQFDAERGSLAGWLNGIARRQVALYFRRQVRHPVAVAMGVEAVAAESPAEQSPAAVAESRELAAQVRGTLSELPPDYEMILTAKYIEGASVAQIAQQEQASDEAIRSKLARARRAFRRKFDEKNENAKAES